MNNIKKLREQIGMTQKQLAQAIGCSESAVSHWEKGKRDPDFETLLKMCDIFGCSVDYLLNNEGETPELEEYVFAIRNSPERRQLLDMTMWMPKEKLQKLLKLIEVWNE